MKERLWHQWSTSTPRVLGVLSLTAHFVWPPFQLDDEVFAFNTGCGRVRVVETPKFSVGNMPAINFSHRWSATCVEGQEVEVWKKEHQGWPVVLVSLGVGIIATDCLGVISIWNKRTGGMEYRGKVAKFENESGVIQVVRGQEEVVMVGGLRDGGFAILARGEEGWQVKITLATPNQGRVTGFLSECERLVVVAGRLREDDQEAGVSVWSLGDGQPLNISTDIQPGRFQALAFPHLFTTCSKDYPGVKVWDVEGGKLVLHLLPATLGLHPLAACHHLSTNGPFLVVQAFQEGEEAGNSLVVKLLRHEEMTLTDAGDESLWSRTVYKGQFKMPFYHLPLTSTGLMVQAGNSLQLLDYWLAPLHQGVVLEAKGQGREGRRRQGMERLLRTTAKAMTAITIRGIVTLMD